MSEQEIEKKNQEKEVDLYQILSKMGKGLKDFFVNSITFIFKWLWFGISVSFTQTLYFFIRHFIVLSLVTILGGSIGILYTRFEKPYYLTNMTARSNIVPNSSLISYINRLHELSMVNDTIGLSRQLKLDTSITKNIKDIQAYWLIDKNNDGIADEIDFNNQFDPDTTKLARKIGDRFYILMSIYDNTIIDSVNKGIRYYINTNQYITERKIDKETRLKEMLLTYNKELKDLDSLKRFEYFELQRKNEMSLNIKEFVLNLDEKKEARLLYTNVLELAAQIRNIKTELRLEMEPITIIDNFVPTNRPIKHPIRNVAFWGGLFFLITTIVLIVIERWEPLMRMIKNSKR